MSFGYVAHNSAALLFAGRSVFTETFSETITLAADSVVSLSGQEDLTLSDSVDHSGSFLEALVDSLGGNFYNVIVVEGVVLADFTLEGYIPGNNSGGSPSPSPIPTPTPTPGPTPTPSPVPVPVGPPATQWTDVPGTVVTNWTVIGTLGGVPSPSKTP